MFYPRSQRKRVVCGRAHSDGFTLIELMVTVAVIAVMAAIAFPSFTGLLNSNRLTGAANELVAGLQGARAEAIRRNQSITVCRSDDGAACSVGADGASWGGWIAIAADNTVLQSGVIRSPIELHVSNKITDSRIVFRPDGFARNAATGNILTASFGICIPTTKPNENMRRVSLMAGSRIAVDREDESGDCPRPENS